jgi:DNA topoisomerase-1
MRAAQQLYEGIEIGDEGQVGLITYMRTDSVRVSDSALGALREFIGANYAKAYLPEAPTVHKGGRGSRVQDAHEAIRPTDVSRRPEPLKGQLESDPFKLYQLIWRRFVADGAVRIRDHHGGLRPRPLPVPGHGVAGAVRRLPGALPRGP